MVENEALFPDRKEVRSTMVSVKFEHFQGDLG